MCLPQRAVDQPRRFFSLDPIPTTGGGIFFAKSPDGYDDDVERVQPLNVIISGGRGRNLEGSMPNALGSERAWHYSVGDFSRPTLRPRRLAIDAATVPSRCPNTGFRTQVHGLRSSFVCFAEVRADEVGEPASTKVRAFNDARCKLFRFRAHLRGSTEWTTESWQVGSPYRRRSRRALNPLGRSPFG